MSRSPLADDLEDLASPRSVGWALAGLAVGAAFALVLLPRAAPALAASLVAPQPKAWWYLSRASGLVSYVLLSLSMLFGLLLSNRFAKSWPGSALAFTLHEHASILGLALASFHGLVLLGDRHTPFTAAQVLLPFGAAFRPAAVGLGQVALYGAGLLVASFYLRGRLGPRAWRGIHFASFGVFALVVAHGVAAGTDRAALLLSGALPFAVVLFLAVHRALTRLLGEASGP